MDNHEALDVLQEEILKVWDEYGWVQGKLGDDDSGYCMVGAYSKALQPEGQVRQLSMPGWLSSAIVRQAGELFGAKTGTPIGVNDTTGRSAEDMRLVVKHAFQELHDHLDKMAPPPDAA